MVANALSRKTPQEKAITRLTAQPELQRDLARLEVEIQFPDVDRHLGALELVPDLLDEIRQNRIPVLPYPGFGRGCLGTRHHSF